MTRRVAEEPLPAGREAASKHAWREAYTHLKAADEVEALGGADLESLADAAWWTGRLDEALALRERAFSAFTREGQPARAAVLALSLAMDFAQKGAPAVAGGWLSRAGSLLEHEEESAAHAFLALTRGMTAFDEGRLDEATAQLERAGELALRHGDANVAAMALVFRGMSLVTAGEVDAGLELLDAATASAVGDELDPLATGIVYCVTIDSCQALGDCSRAAQWTDAANRWCDRLDISGFPGACRIHRAEIMRLKGEWPRAEEQALAACEELQDYNRFVTANGYYEIGEIRRRRGEFAAAEESYAKARELGRKPEPGNALLRLAQGKVEAAARAIKRELARPELDPLGRAKRLPAQVEIALAAGELERARDAADELERIADAYRPGAGRTPALEGAVRLARGQIQLAERDWEGAGASLRAARDTWQKVGAPYETAHACLLLALAYRGEGDEDAARDELRAARAGFEGLGAVLDAQRARELLGEAGARVERTFMFTDIVDSTKLVEVLGEDKWRKLLAWHDRTLREQIVDAGGEVIKHTGDGYFAAFGAVAPALEAAAAIQRALEAHEPFAPDVRIGVHSGGAFHRADDDYAGQGVHMAARIGALAGAGEILVSVDSLDGASAFRLEDRRAEALKGFDEPVELGRVAWR
jgi:class 3 adenylate cyclase/predicted negative regulator of RcsB-dependent stress response